MNDLQQIFSDLLWDESGQDLIADRTELLT
jgi:hypothetical protein